MSTEELASKSILPGVNGLFEGNPKPDAILLSHAHLDHTGLLDHTQPEIPIYASSGTSKMMLAGKLFAMQVELPRDRFKEVTAGRLITIGGFKITGYSVDHSIYGCLAYLVEAQGKSLLYTGDLRLHGRKPGMGRSLVKALQGRTINAMIMEGTHFGLADGHDVTEYELEEEIVQKVREAPGLILASFSPQHVDRLVAFIRAAMKTDRIFVADVYTAVVLHLLGTEIGGPVPGAGNSLRVYFPSTFVGTAKEKNLANLVDRFRSVQITIEEIQKSPEKFVMVYRPSMQIDFGDKLPEQSVCLYSRWTGYLEHPDWKRTAAALKAVSGRIIEVHTSGHILSRDIVPFVNAIGPKAVIPIHTFEPEQFQAHFRNVTLAEDGVPFEIA